MRKFLKISLRELKKKEIKINKVDKKVEEILNYVAVFKIEVISLSYKKHL